MREFGLVLALASSLQMQAPQTCESLFFSIVPRQSEANSCGYAVLAGLIGLAAAQRKTLGSGYPLQVAVDEAQLLERYGGASRKGLGSMETPKTLSLGSMARVLTDYGIPSLLLRIVPGAMDAVLAGPAPIVLHYDKPAPHFVLALGAEDGYAVLADPADGLVALSSEELAGRASGYALLPLLAPEREGRPQTIVDEAKKAASLRRKRLDLIAGSAFGGGAANVAARKKGLENVRVELGMSAASMRGADGFSFSPTIFFAGEWAPSDAIALFAEASVKANEWRPFSVASRLSAGLEWRRLSRERNRSLGIALLAGGDDDLLESGLRLRYSALADPFLLTGTMTAGIGLPRRSLGESGPPAVIQAVAIEPKFSALCALSSTMAVELELCQTFKLGLSGSARIEWLGRLELGILMPIGDWLCGTGARVYLDEESDSRGEAVISIAR